MKTNFGWLSWPLLVAMISVSGTTARSVVFWDQASQDAGRAFGASHDYDFVGCFSVQSSAGPYWASFSLVDPWHAITAAHIFLNPNGRTVTSVTGTFGANSLTSQICTVGVTSWVTHPDYTANTPVGSGYDVAVVTFDRPVTEVAPIPIYQGSLEPVFMAHVAGFGKPGISGNGLGTFVGDRYAGVTAIGDDSWSHGGPQYLIGGFDPYGGYADTLVLSPGDSGGALAVSVNGHLELAGVNCFGVINGNYGIWSKSGYLNLTDPVSRGWVLAQVPEPSPVAVFVLGCITMGCLRRPRVRLA